MTQDNNHLPSHMPTSSTPHPYYLSTPPEDEINLLELTDKFLDQWRWWVSGTVVGGLLGLGAAFALPPKYEAHGVVRVAQVGMIESDSQGEIRTTPLLVESAPETIVRM